MKLKAALLLVTLVAALASVSGRRFYSPKSGNAGDRQSIRVKTVVSWVCKLLRKLQITSAETLCNHSHPPPPFSVPTWRPYRTTWSPYRTTWSPYRTTWNPFRRTTWSPYRTTWRPYRTTWSPYRRTTWSPYRTTWRPYRTTWSPYRRTTWNPYRTTWSPYRTTWSPYRTTWRPHGTTWYPENTRFDFVTGWPRTADDTVAPSTGAPWPVPGRSFDLKTLKTLKKVEKLTAKFILTGPVKEIYDKLVDKLGEHRTDLCDELANLLLGSFQGRQRNLQEEFKAAMAHYYSKFCVKKEKPDSASPPPHVPEIVKPVAPVSTGQCGQSLKLRKLTKASRIVGGKNTGSCDVIPWQVRVKSQMGLCGGSIISSRHILTAAHCVNEITSVSEVSVVVGDYNTKQTESSEQTHTVRNVSFHDQFNINNYENDVALLTLDQPVDLTNPCVQPVCRNASFVPNNMFCTVSGWGTTSSGGKTSESLQMVQVLTFKGSECKSEFSIPKNYPDYMTSADKQLCAGKVGGGQDSCQGDSGGPLVCLHPESKTFIQVGIVSYGIGCAVKGFPGVYSSVAAFNGWIETAMAQN